MTILTFYNGHIMIWNIAQAKQQFSEVVRLAAQEPQAIYNRDKPVAVMINADDFEAFRQWRAGQHAPTLAAQFAESRLALQQAGADALRIPARVDVQRPNAFVQMLESEQRPKPPAPN
jgi:prevent-host-death family protein